MCPLNFAFPPLVSRFSVSALGTTSVLSDMTSESREALSVSLSNYYLQGALSSANANRAEVDPHFPTPYQKHSTRDARARTASAAAAALRKAAAGGKSCS